MTTPDDYEIIQHFGTKGMRWGVRKSRKPPKPGSFRSLNKSEKRTAYKVFGGTAAVAAGSVAAALIMNKRDSNRRVSAPPIRPFMAAGKNWRVEANDGHTFDVLVRNLSEQRK